MVEKVPISQWVERWYYVLASHRPSQLGWRALKLLQRRCFPLLPKSTYLSVDVVPVPRKNRGLDAILNRQLAIHVSHGDLAARVERLLAGDFCFLNETRQLSQLGDVPLDATPPVSHLWRFHFHYQEYLLDLLAAARHGIHPEAMDRIWPLVESWIAANPITRPGALNDAWHPFCLSRRIAVWILLWHANVIPDRHRTKFANSLESQTRFLERHLEWDLRGNHLFENLRTLALTGGSWGDEVADRRLDSAVRLLAEQFDEQILSSGEHFERSPMYHAQMLSAVLDIRDITADVRPEFSRSCQEVSERMSYFLRDILHPDGQIPLLSDSTLEESPSASLLISDSESIASIGNSETSAQRARSESGDCWTWRDNDDYLLLDHGPVGADSLPAHAHNDLLTIEASLGGKRFIIDSGVFDYADSEMRHACRSTAAHNTLQIDGEEQCDLWSRFRMGRRGRPTGFQSGTDGGFSWAVASHNAYAHIGVLSVGRWISCRPGGPWIVADWAYGSGERQLDHWLHLAPEVVVDEHSEHGAGLRLDSREVRLNYVSAGTLSVETAWYCPDFGVRIAAPVARFRQEATLPAMIVWTLDWGTSSGQTIVETDERGETLIVWQDGSCRSAWNPMTLL